MTDREEIKSMYRIVQAYTCRRFPDRMFISGKASKFIEALSNEHLGKLMCSFKEGKYLSDKDTTEIYEVLLRTADPKELETLKKEIGEEK